MLIRFAEKALRLYVTLTCPWILAKFYTAWEYYQHDDVYRERLMTFGFRDAVKWFVDDKISRNYCLKKALEKNPELKWQIMFFPWSISRPDIFDIAADSGALNNLRA
ncbi:MAG: hypothetical protein G01um101444_479 [Parcubacteria group bacterium Gr01-1014_44]|nr:MAG: hypothetical protein G01um101444_479 [Parcubacteria group bacterium Gr01-1014_44]